MQLLTCKWDVFHLTGLYSDPFFSSSFSNSYCEVQLETFDGMISDIFENGWLCHSQGAPFFQFIFRCRITCSDWKILCYLTFEYLLINVLSRIAYLI